MLLIEFEELNPVIPLEFIPVALAVDSAVAFFWTAVLVGRAADVLLLVLAFVFAASFVLCAATNEMWYGDDNSAIIETNKFLLESQHYSDVYFYEYP